MAMSDARAVRPSDMMFAGSTGHARAVCLTLQKAAWCYTCETRATCEKSGTGRTL
jgi:hypothetical protein